MHVSATSHWPAEARHVKLAARNASTHVLAVPEQWSAESLSHEPPCDAPVQPVDADANPSEGHEPELPVHVSATSHCPAEARQVKLAAWKASTHAFAVPEQWSAESLSHAPP